MKTICHLSLLAAVLLSALPAHSAPGAKVELGCHVDHLQLNEDTGKYKATRLAADKTAPFLLGRTPSPDLVIALPFPFSDLSLEVANDLVKFPDEEEWLGHIVAGFYQRKTPGEDGQERGTSLGLSEVIADFSSAAPGSRIILEGSADVNGQRLAYLCTLKFLE